MKALLDALSGLVPGPGSPVPQEDCPDIQQHFFVENFIKSPVTNTYNLIPLIEGNH